MALADAKGKAPIGGAHLDGQLAGQHKKMVGDFGVGMPGDYFAGREGEQANPHMASRLSAFAWAMALQSCRVGGSQCT